MSTEELAKLQSTLKDISDIADKANKVFGFVKYLVWAVCGLGTIILGSGIWVYATNHQLAADTSRISSLELKSESVIQYESKQDVINQKLTDAVSNITELLKLHMQHDGQKIDKKSP